MNVRVALRSIAHGTDKDLSDRSMNYMTYRDTVHVQVVHIYEGDDAEFGQKVPQVVFAVWVFLSWRLRP